jgi:hypothetical protein
MLGIFSLNLHACRQTLNQFEWKNGSSYSSKHQAWSCTVIYFVHFTYILADLPATYHSISYTLEVIFLLILGIHRSPPPPTFYLLTLLLESPRLNHHTISLFHLLLLCLLHLLRHAQPRRWKPGYNSVLRVFETPFLSCFAGATKDASYDLNAA